MKLKKLLALGLIVSSIMVVSQSAFACTICDKKPFPGGGYEYYNCRYIPCTDANIRN